MKSLLAFSSNLNLRFLTPLSEILMNADMNRLLKFIHERIQRTISSLFRLVISIFMSSMLSMKDSDIWFTISDFSSVLNE